jgi:hypothetical protein
VRVAHVLTDEETDLPADTVIVSSSGVGRDALYHALHEASQRQVDVPFALHLIGDAFAPRQLRHAMVDGARVGREV